MNAPQSHSLVSRLVSPVLLPALVMGSVPLSPARVLAEDAAPMVAASPAPEAPQVNRTVPDVDPQVSTPHFSIPPTEAEIFAVRVFAEPLTPLGATSPTENTALARAIEAYVGRSNDSDDLSAFQAFLDRHPDSAWKASLLTNMGIVWRRTGYVTSALEAWERAWGLGKDADEPKAKATADRTLGELLELTSRLGRRDRLESLLDEVEGRDVRGAATERVSAARQALYLMRNHPEASFRCGPLALFKIQRATGGHENSRRLVDAESTPQGTSLAQMAALAGEAGMEMQPAYRSSAGSFIVPAMVHWKAGHFAAITEQQGDRFKIEDATFGEEMWVSQAALLAETSGYFLVPGGSLPAGWRAVGSDEAATVWGKGIPAGQNSEAQTPADGKIGGTTEPCPMAAYSFHSMLANLNITDSPVGYTPPVGSPVEFQVTYNHRDAFQPQIFTYSNLGQKWTFNWMSYITDDPGLVGQSPTLYVRGGGQETYTGFNSSTNSYARHYKSHAVLVRMSGSPIRYERLLPDGSKEVFALPDGAQTAPRKIFMTEWRDPQNNPVQLTYDFVFGTNPRLVAIRDAVGPGQVTTLSYELPGDPLKITKVTDPFGRFATFEYNPQSQLKKITDVIGITSEFAYGVGDFIQSMTTPYGTTLFAMGDDGRQRWIQATDPLGARELLYYQNNTASVVPVTASPSVVPTGFEALNILLSGVSFYWDKIAMARAEGDFSKARVTYWMRAPGTLLSDGVKRIEKLPLENPVWYAYPNQIGRTLADESLPSQVARVLDDGTSQIYRYEYNSSGKVCKATDPLGRETRYTYGTNNVADPVCTSGSSIDFLKVEQKNGAGYDILEMRTYNSQHQPLTITDAAGQPTNYTYLPDGRLQTVVTPPRAGLAAAERTTTYGYYPDNAPTGAGGLQTATGPSMPQGSPATSYTYDGFGRVRTTTDPDNYTLTYDYDALDRPTKTTYPDATYEETVYNRLDAEKRRDRLGRWTHTFHDALRRVVATRDPLGRAVTQKWCSCGSLDKLIDANGNATSWDRDLQGRVTKEIRADQSFKTFIYENTTSRLKSVTDARNQTKTYGYALDDRLTSTTYTSAVVATPNVTVSYMDPDNPTAPDPYGRLRLMTDGTGTTRYDYKPAGTLGAGRFSSVDGPLTSDTVSYSYDELRRVTTQGLTAFSTTSAYDALGRLNTLTSPMGNFIWTYVNTAERAQTVTYPNSQITTYTYFSNAGDKRLQQIKHQQAAGGTVLSQFDYTYDAVGNIKTWTQQRGADPAKVYTLGYDPADQLWMATVTGPNPLPVPSRFRYAYDSAGNRSVEELDDAGMGATHNNRNQLISRQPGGTLLFRGTLSEQATVTVQSKPTQVASDNSFAAPAQVSSGATDVVVAATDPSGNTRTNTYRVNQSGSTATYTHDPNGNLTGDGTSTFEWDAEDRLTKVTQGASELARFTYDGQGRRAQKIAGGVTRTYVYDGSDIIEERLSSGQTYDYVHGPGIDRPLVTRDQVGGVSYYLADHLGSIVQTTSSAGTVNLTREYDSWGNALQGGATSGYAFTGREWDAEASLYYYRARYYDPKIGRFISEDPIGFKGGINFYAYVSNNPVRWTDPFGLQAYIWRPPAPCPTDPCMQECLQKVMGTPPPVIVRPNSGTLAAALGYAVSGPNSIALPGSCDDFFSSPPWVLHEYYHITQHWPRFGFALRYVVNPKPWDDEADNFAQTMAPILQDCLDSCRTCK